MFEEKLPWPGRSPSTSAHGPTVKDHDCPHWCPLEMLVPDLPTCVAYSRVQALAALQLLSPAQSFS